MLATTPFPRRLIYSRRQAAEALSVSERTLDRMIAGGFIKAIKISVGRRGIPDSEITRIAGGEGVGSGDAQ